MKKLHTRESKMTMLDFVKAVLVGTGAVFLAITSFALTVNVLRAYQLTRNSVHSRTVREI
jgi:hypothetical protein